jgi:hypothetical protein
MDTIPEHALLKVKGSASLNVPYTIQDGVTLQFTSEDWPGSSLIMTCDIDDAVQNRLLDCVEVLRLVYQVVSLDDGQSWDVFNTPNIRNLHNLQGLELMHFNFTTEERASLKTCLRNCQGQIKYVNLIGCDTVLEAGVYPYFSAVPDHGHVLGSRVSDLCLFSDISDLFRTFAFQTLVLLDRLCLLRVA